MTIIGKGAELGADIFEPAIDGLIESLTDSQVIKDVPILGIAVKVAGFGKSIVDRIFLKKVQRFLQGIDQATIESAKTFAHELESGEADAVRTAETLVLALDSMNDMEKAPILAAVFTAFLKGEIGKTDFRRITAAVNTAIVDDLLALASLGPQFGGDSRTHESLLSSLRHTGFAGETHVVLATEEDIELCDAVTPLGKMFARAVGGSELLRHA